MNRWLDRLKQCVRFLKLDVIALWIAAHDSRTPIIAKIVAGSIAAYALSPIDFIPDFIPVLGYLDDLLIVPIGIALAIRLIPAILMAEFRSTAELRNERPASHAGMLTIIAFWVAGAGSVIYLLWTSLG
ncbi:YkvA family protein [Pararhizobium arenae]|uniref:YkvA family protein n=1 Tax=Pararhizobium arenae TaxID=1856850 RepID=UPI00094AC5F3|nr:YkvA family protein [Pararhizobium arenae]